MIPIIFLGGDIFLYFSVYMGLIVELIEFSVFIKSKSGFGRCVLMVTLATSCIFNG